MSEHPQDSEHDAGIGAAPEGAIDDERPDEDDIRDPDPEQSDPESSGAA